MEENFNPVARTRANYYTPGSPVQFVCVELLKGDVSGEHAVCLTFKNISKVTLTALEIHFKCKGVDGVILCEDRFEYRDLEVKPGELFGMDDAVFVTAKAITSVDVSLCNVYNGKRVVHLDGIKRVRLPAPKRLSAELEKALETRMNRPELKYQPQVFENGWYFKNISKVTLTALEIHFKCKGVDGVILCEDRFEYRDLEVKPGELFGMDDAVFVTAKAITSVDVSLCNVYNGKRVVHLDGIKRVRLPAPKRLSAELEKALETRMNRPELKYQPQVFENGWYCACGAFHPKEEDTVYCSECGCDRILLQNALNTLLQPEQPAQTEPELETPLAPQAEEPTRIMGAAPVQEEPTRIMGAPCREAEPQPEEPAAEQTRVMDAGMRAQFPGRASHAAADEGTRVMPAAARRAQPISQQPEPAYDDEEEYEDERDSVAEALIRWVPPITAIVCAAVALCGFVYYQFVL